MHASVGEHERAALADKLAADTSRLAASAELARLRDIGLYMTDSNQELVLPGLPGQLESLAIPVLVRVFGWAWEDVEHLSVRWRAGAAASLLPSLSTF
jgi:putative methionine-R-sulfoxide reductase with GAF domain